MDTVNDSHMVASGVPDKNGDRHASIIASMALDVMVSLVVALHFNTYIIPSLLRPQKHGWQHQ